MAKAGARYEVETGNIWGYAHRGDMTGVRAALARGVDPNLLNVAGWSASHAAGKAHHPHSNSPIPPPCHLPTSPPHLLAASGGRTHESAQLPAQSRR